MSEHDPTKDVFGDPIVRAGYVLDGIETAMETRRYSVGCPCGWIGPNKRDMSERAFAALRFHYTWCPKARKPGGEYIEGYGEIVVNTSSDWLRYLNDDLGTPS